MGRHRRCPWPAHHQLHDPGRVELGKTLTNYVLTHGLTDQMTVERAVFLDAAKEAGLFWDKRYHKLFPDDPELATVSVSYFSLTEADSVPPHYWAFPG